MHIPEKYFHDKLVLLLASISGLLAVLTIVLILLRAGIGQSTNDYIVAYRENLGLSAYQRGSILSILSFGLFVIVILIINIVLSIRTYTIRRTLSLTVLGLGILVLVLSLIISNALLTLY